MLTPTNEEILLSQQALGSLVQARLPATQALNVRDAVEDVEDRVQTLQEVNEDLRDRDDMDEEDFREEWNQLMQETTEIGCDPVPETALEDAKISAQDLMALDWILDRGEDQ